MCTNLQYPELSLEIWFIQYAERKPVILIEVLSLDECVVPEDNSSSPQSLARKQLKPTELISVTYFIQNFRHFMGYVY
jgi:hypothetical protein